MKAVWKFPFALKGDFTLALPTGARILHVDLQDGHPHLWALVDVDTPATLYHFRIYGTGHYIEPGDFVYAGTIQTPPYVWHLFAPPELIHNKEN